MSHITVNKHLTSIEFNKSVNNVVDEKTSFELAFKHFNSIWASTQKELLNLLKLEAPVDKPKLVEKRLTAVRETSILYLKYIRINNKLVHCYERLSQPQKRRFLRNLSEACIGRVLELKHELVDLEKSDFQFMDQQLLNLRMLPSDMDIKIPEYFKEPVDKEDIESKSIVEHYLQNLRRVDIGQEVVTKEEKNDRMGKVFLRMIQAHERARQDRVHFQDLLARRLCKKEKEQTEIRKNMTFRKSETDYAIIIQKAWRRFILRKRISHLYSVEMQFLNILPSNDNKISQDIEKHRQRVIKRNEYEYLDAKERMKQEMFVYNAPRISEEIEERIRSYIHEYKDIHKRFPTFPTEEEGGSIAMLNVPLIKTPETEEMASELEVKGGKKNIKSSKGTKGKKEKKDKKSKGKDSEEDEPEGYSLKPSKYVPVILKLVDEYQKIWLGRELVSFDGYDDILLKGEVTEEIKTEVRLAVDEKMREEIAVLEKALQKDTKKKKKAKKAKKKNKSKKNKGKKEIDLTPDRSLDSLVSELIDNGIITNYPKLSINDFWGEYNYSGAFQQTSGQFEGDPLPCLADIKRVVKEYCILPMGSKTIHSGGAYIRSILFAGPKGSGKKKLIHAICNEIQATMINLSAENLEGKYPGYEGSVMLAHLVSKVSRLVQPTIIYVKDAENYFWKETPSTSKLSEPGRLNKHLTKMVKRFGNPDRVLVCGTTNLPFNNVNPKGLSGCYEKIVCIFKPDYNCRNQLWNQMIHKFGGNSLANSEMYVLSNVSDGFTAGHMEETVRKVLNGRRLASQNKFPLCAKDFASVLAEHVPVYQSEHQAYNAWLQKMPLGNERAGMLEKEREKNPEEEEEEEDD